MSQTLQSVKHALLVIKELQVRGAAGVTELASALGVGTSTMHRLLVTLQQQGFVEQTTGRRYRLGDAMTKTPEAAAIDHCVDVGFDELRSLRNESGETVHFSVLDGNRSKFVAALESPHIMRVTSRVGRTIPAHASAAGKVLLAELTLDELHALYPFEHLASATPASINSRTVLERELEDVRQLGYGRNLGESEAGLAALAVGIPRPSGRTLCTLTVTGPTSRFYPVDRTVDSSRESELRDMLISHAERISRLLAY